MPINSKKVSYICQYMLLFTPILVENRPISTVHVFVKTKINHVFDLSDTWVRYIVLFISKLEYSRTSTKRVEKGYKVKILLLSTVYSTAPPPLIL
jgi:hypothetical protein